VTAVLSGTSADALRESLGRDALVLPPGVRLEEFPVREEPRRGPPVVLFSASLEDRRKRADLAVAMFGRVLAVHPEARLQLSGQGDPGWALADATPSVRAAVDIPGPGRPGEIPGRYRAATVTVLPAEHEAFGLALVESLASGTPVVATESGGMPEIAGNRAVGRVARADPESLAGAVLEAIVLAAGPETPRRCAREAIRWGWEETVGPAHEDLYRKMAGALLEAAR
jgi:glycosyltransferase involved in cell wall biosynthesis